MTEVLEFNFRTDKRKQWAQPSWRGRRVRGIELDQQRFEAKAARDRARRARVTDPHREPSMRLLEAWAPVEDQLRQAIDSATFAIWCRLLHPHRFVSGTWVLAHHPLHVGWVRDRFGRLIAEVAQRPVEFVVCEALR